VKMEARGVAVSIRLWATHRLRMGEGARPHRCTGMCRDAHSIALVFDGIRQTWTVDGGRRESTSLSEGDTATAEQRTKYNAYQREDQLRRYHLNPEVHKAVNERSKRRATVKKPASALSPEQLAKRPASDAARWARRRAAKKVAALATRCPIRPPRRQPLIIAGCRSWGSVAL